jgi:hypothetical protein
MFTPGSKNYINKLRIVGDVDDSLAFQLRLQSLLSSTDFSIPGISPSSVVCIRSLPDPCPLTLRLVRSELEGADTWSRALAQSLARKVDRAVRPATGLVPANAECVLFADKAEMLASVARDWLSGLLWTRWWWQSLLPAGDSSEIVKQLWRDHPQYAPAALDQLERGNKALSFVSALADAECRELVQQTVRSFAIQELSTVCQASLPTGHYDRSETSTRFFRPPGLAPHIFEQHPLTVPWKLGHRYQSSSALSAEQQRFLGIALTILRAPSYARTREFARAVERWQAAIARRVQDDQDDRENVEVFALAHAEEQVESRPASSSGVGIVSSTQPEQHTAHRDREVADGYSDVIYDGEEGQSQIESSHKESSTVAASDSPRHDSIGTKVLSPTFNPLGNITNVQEWEREVSDLTQPDLILWDSVDDSVEAASIETETQLGGLFYLINLALYLDLYGDFTMPTAPGIELNLWDFVALVGAELASGVLEEDPIWSLLAHLAGRDEEEPVGSSFTPGAEWRLPPEWLSMFSDDRPWRWSAGSRRLRVLHPEGFLILDLPLAKDVREQLQREIKPYDVSSRSLLRGRMLRLSRVRSKVAASPEVRRWLLRLMPYVCARLCLALGLESREEIATMLCQRYARVGATDTHIDVFYRLSDLPLEIRFAGLDRDPGWVPAAGRFITFHFD